jgi:hypothetical protein
MGELSHTDPIATEGRLARIETKLDIHLERTNDHALRLKWLETKINYFIGVFAVIQGLVMLYSAKLMRLLGN